VLEKLAGVLIEKDRLLKIGLVEYVIFVWRGAACACILVEEHRRDAYAT
jgi:hypothetical protein